MRFFFFVSLSRLLRTPFFAEKREKREEIEREREIYISPVRDVSEEKQKRIFENSLKGANCIDRFFII